MECCITESICYDSQIVLQARHHHSCFWSFLDVPDRSQKTPIVQERSFKIQKSKFSEHSHERSWFKAIIFCERPGTIRNDRRTFILTVNVPERS